MMATNTVTFDWMLCRTPALRQGRYGPVFQAMADGGKLLWAEALGPQGPALDRLPPLQKTTDADDRHVVPFLGVAHKEGQVYLLTETIHGGTLREFVSTYKRFVVSPATARVVLGALVAGTEHVRSRCGPDLVFLDPDHIWMDFDGTPRIEVPLLIDGFLPGQPRPPPLRNGRGAGQRPADAWLVGLIAVELLSDEDPAVIARAAEKHDMAALEAMLRLDDSPESARVRDFVRQCLGGQGGEGPDISALRRHPLFAVGQ